MKTGVVCRRGEEGRGAARRGSPKLGTLLIPYADPSCIPTPIGKSDQIWITVCRSWIWMRARDRGTFWRRETPELGRNRNRPIASLDSGRLEDIDMYCTVMC